MISLATGVLLFGLWGGSLPLVSVPLGKKINKFSKKLMNFLQTRQR